MPSSNAAEYVIEEIYANRYNTTTTSRKNIGDIYVDDIPINIKSNNIEKNNYSPNLISAKRAFDYLTNTNNQLKFLFVSYYNKDYQVHIVDDQEVWVDHISWDCLTIQCQGNGVIQMKSKLIIDESQTREQWLEGLREKYLDYIQRQRKKLDRLEAMVS
jgi:hypothetical protein